MCCNLDHIPLLFLAFDTSFLSSNEVGNATSRPLESKVNKKKNFFSETAPKLSSTLRAICR